MAGVDAVVHFAAESHVDRSIVGSDDFVNTNCFGTNVVMDTARRLEIGRVVHIGTDEVYGSVEVGSSKETDPLEPRSPYSASKAGSDLIALSYHHTHGAAGHRHPLHQQLRARTSTRRRRSRCSPPTCSTAARSRSTATASTSATGSTSTTTAPACTSCSTRARPARSTTSAPATRRPNRVLVDKLLALLGKDESSVDYVEDRLGHDRRYSVDIAKITDLGWTKQRTLDEALEETVDWYRANEWWWRPLKSAALMRVLITGAGGQLGTDLVRTCTAAGDEVDRLRPRRARPHRPRLRAQAITGDAARRRAQRRRLDRGRRVRDRPRPGVPHQRPGRPVGGRRRPPGRARTCVHVSHRLRLRRHQARAVPRVGPTPTRSRSTAARSWAASARLDPRRHDRAHVVGVRRPRPQHGEDGARRWPTGPSWPSSTTSAAVPASPPTWRRAIRRLAVARMPGHLPRHQPGRHHLVRVRARHPRAGRRTTRPRSARSPPPSSIRPGRRPARPTRCSTTPPCACGASRCCPTTVSPSIASCGSCRP